MGHAVIGVSDVDASNAFYVDLLGFRLSDVTRAAIVALALE